MSFLVAAISLGFLSSFHCIGMCGPIALALPIGKAGPLKRFFLIITYNLGRVLTYSALGLVFGLIGQSVALGGYQQLLSISIGSILLMSVVLPGSTAFKSRFVGNSFQIFSRIKSQLSALFLQKGFRSLFLIGLLNGLLPCGMVYLAIAGAVASGNMLHGSFFMALFGLGTLPVMLCLPVFGQYLSAPFRNGIRKSVPLIVGTMAILLILRGLNLGIPYLSPKMDATMVSCHHEKNSLSAYHKKTIVCTGPSSTPKK